MLAVGPELVAVLEQAGDAAQVDHAVYGFSISCQIGVAIPAKAVPTIR
jgi:hypothetical protein